MTRARCSSEKPGRRPGFTPIAIFKSERGQEFIMQAVFIIQTSMPHSTNEAILANKVKWEAMHVDLLAQFCHHLFVESIAKPEASSLALSARKDHGPVHHPHTCLPFSASCFEKLFCQSASVKWPWSTSRTVHECSISPTRGTGIQHQCRIGYCDLSLGIELACLGKYCLYALAFPVEHTRT